MQGEYWLNNPQDIVLSELRTFELWSSFSGEKKIFLAPGEKRYYGACIQDTQLSMQVETQHPWSSVDILLVCPIRKGQPLDLSLSLNILHSDCEINVHIVSLVFSGDTNSVNAGIYMGEGIKDSKSSLLEETIIIGDEVRIKNVPMLDVHSHEIQAAHGAKLYRLDEDHLFYLCSRGFSYQEAQALLINSYFNLLWTMLEIDEAHQQEILTRFLDH